MTDLNISNVDNGNFNLSSILSLAIVYTYSSVVCPSNSFSAVRLRESQIQKTQKIMYIHNNFYNNYTIINQNIHVSVRDDDDEEIIDSGI